MNEVYIYFIIKSISLVSSGILLMAEEREAGGLVMRLLAFCCLILAELLIGIFKQGKYKKWIWLCVALQSAACFLFGVDDVFPLLVFLIWEWAELLGAGEMFYQLGAVCTLLLWILYTPSLFYAVLTAGYTALFIFIREWNCACRRQKETVYEQKETLAALQKKLEDMGTYVKTVRDTAAMEERNRFAARIHDQLGHNISGSIILLEAAVMSMDKNPEGARKNIQQVTESLRGGVDEIRLALRQERPGRSRLGLSEIRQQLEAFQTTYGIRTRLEVEGSVEKVGIPIWLCIQENLKEALTNMLKHSRGDCFTLKLTGMNRILRVEYGDNGKPAEEGMFQEAEFGLGLSAIEERTAACGGKCMVHGGSGGFVITNIFML